MVADFGTSLEYTGKPFAPPPSMKKIQKKLKGLKLSLPRKGKKSRPDIVVNLPPELLVYILNWVKHIPNNRHTVQDWISRNNITDWDVIYDALEQSSARYTLRKCALVCAFWAKCARHAMFYGATLHVETFERAEAFKHYSTQGSPRLGRICDLIKRIWVSVQLPDTLRSFLSLICFAETRTKLDKLDIVGPFPNGYPPCKQDNPHWNLPDCAVPSPSNTPWHMVAVSAIQFPSYHHFAKFLRYFSKASVFHLGELSWEGKPPSYLEFFKKPAAQYRNSLEVYVQCCRDDVVMGLQVALMFPDCPLRAVTSRDRDCAVDLMKLVGEFYEGVPPAEPKHESLKYCFKCSSPRRYKWHTFTLQMSNVPREYVEITLTMACDMHPGSPHASPGRDHSPTKPRIRGVTIMFTSLCPPDKHPDLLMNDISMMQRSIESNESLRHVVLVFPSRPMMEAAVARYPSICEATPHHLKYVLACQFPHPRVPSGSRYVEIDRKTLEPTDMTVNWSPEGAMDGRLSETFS